MIDREHVLAVLRKRFPGAPADEIAAAANAIVALPDEWEEVQVNQTRLGHDFSRRGSAIRSAAEEMHEDMELRIFRKRNPETK